MRKNKIPKIRLAAFFMVCQFFICTMPCDTSMAANEKKQKEDEVSQNDDSGQQRVEVKELDLGNYEDTMTVGSKQLLSVTVLPISTTVQNVEYYSSDEKVASINGMGRITACEIGTTEITVSCEKVIEKFMLTVIEDIKDTEVLDIEVADYEEELEVGKTTALSVGVIPDNAKEAKVVFTSSNTNIATVSSAGEVKGIAPGQVTITMQAGGVAKSINLRVKVTAVSIHLNSNYVVLKPGEKYQLSGYTQPQEAEQLLNYKSANSEIAEVSANGNIAAKAEGSTTIIVSNEDISNAVTVIVNTKEVKKNNVHKTVMQVNKSKMTDKEAKIMTLLKQQEQIEISASEYEKITPAVLKILYTEKKELCIKSDDYTIRLSGKDIVNCENVLYTKMKFKNTKNGMEFTVNQGKNLPGQIAIELTGTKGYEYVYLYNDSKGKYEKIKQDKMPEFFLDTAGKYFLSNEKIQNEKIHLHIAIGMVIIILGMGVGYMIVKKNYWFW